MQATPTSPCACATSRHLGIITGCIFTELYIYKVVYLQNFIFTELLRPWSQVLSYKKSVAICLHKLHAFCGQVLREWAYTYLLAPPHARLPYGRVQASRIICLFQPPGMFGTVCTSLWCCLCDGALVHNECTGLL